MAGENFDASGLAEAVVKKVGLPRNESQDLWNSC